MTDDQITLGEIHRLVKRQDEMLAALAEEVRNRHHELSDKVNLQIGTIQNQMIEHIGPVAVLKHQIKSAEENLTRLDIEVREMGKQAAKVSLVGTVVAVGAAILPWPWRR